MTSTHAQRIADLLDLADSEGITLPLPADVIARLEDSGAVVDLVTGEILIAADRIRFALTVIGEAVAVVLESEGRP